MPTGSVGAAQAWLATHHTQVLMGAVGGAVLLGLRSRAKGKAVAPGSQTNAGTSTNVNAADPNGAKYTGGAFYDSTANDVYNGIEPQIEALASQINKLGMVPGPVPTPVTPAPTAAPAKPGTPAKPATVSRGGALYTVKRGDTLASVARSFYGSDPHGAYTIAGDNAYALKSGYHAGPQMLTKPLPVGAKINIPTLQEQPGATYH